jgi:hypothetical protein
MGFLIVLALIGAGIGYLDPAFYGQVEEGKAAVEGAVWGLGIGLVIDFIFVLLFGGLFWKASKW